jgi:peptide/nickel transport system permease protein
MRSLVLGAILLGVVILGTASSWILPLPDPLDMEVTERLSPPSWRHPFGTDQYGRDLLSRILRGGTVALGASVVSVGIASLIGIPIGFAAGLIGGILDEVTMRLMDALQAFPSILLAITIVAIMGPGPLNAMVAIGLVNGPVFARLARSVALSLKGRDFVLAAEALGASRLRILRYHILPNSLSYILVQASIGASTAVLAEASLSYIGLGTQPPNPSWGRMLEEARLFLDVAPWMAIFPGFAIFFTVLGFNFLGDGLRDLMDPWRRGRG